MSGEGSADESGNSDPFGLSDDGADEPSSGGAGSVDGGVAAGAKGANPMTMFRNEDGTFDQKAAREAFLGNKPLPGSGPPASGGAAATATPGKPAGKPAPQAASKPNPGALIGGTTAPKVQVDPALLAPADALINQAAKDWNGQKYKQAVVNAEKALKIYQTHLGESHPKIASVKKMIEDAKAKADGK